jgi:DUF971 family protein
VSHGPPPVEVGVAPDEGVTLRWHDGVRTVVGLDDLRRRCPCVACQDRRAEDALTVPDGLRLAGAELVGAYGLAVAWSDGHGDGVYTWEQLRAWGVPPS